MNRTPALTWVLVAVNALVFLRWGTAPDAQWGLEPSRVTSAPLTVLTSAFLHGSIMHIVTNMVVLAQVGSTVERTIGSLRFAFVYAVSVLGSGAAVVLLSDPGVTTVGASGAIFGVIGALLALTMRLGGHAGVLALDIAFMLAMSLVPGVSWQAHVGGLVAGFLVGLLVAPRRSGVETEPTQVPSYGANTRGM